MDAARRQPALTFTRVGVVREGRWLVDGVDWQVGPGERWVVLGPNGAGKTTLIRLAAGYLFPSRGELEILGRRVGKVDLRRLRARIGLASSSLAASLRPTITAADVVMTARHGALEPWWHEYGQADRRRAAELLARMGCGRFGDRAFATLSSGEQQRVQLARTLMAEPELLLLDEPTAGLDLGGREDLVGRLAELAADPDTPPTVLVTHHVDEIPPGFTHALLLRGGRVVAAGAMEEVVGEETLSSCFGVKLRLERRDGRFLAWAVPR